MLTSDLNLSKNCKRIEILKCVLKNVKTKQNKTNYILFIYTFSKVDIILVMRLSMIATRKTFRFSKRQLHNDDH